MSRHRRIIAGPFEVIIPSAGTIKVNQPFVEFSPELITACVEKWSKRIDWQTPENSTAFNNSCMANGFLFLAITHRNKKSFRFSIVPTPQMMDQCAHLVHTETMH